MVALSIYSIASGSASDSLFVLRSPALWGLAALIAGIFLFFRGFPYLKRKRLIQNTPASSIRAASMGAVEISGTVVGPYTLISPLSETDCFYYHAVARSNSKEEEEEEERAEEILYAPFFLDDGTGRLLVDPRGAEMELQTTVETEYSPETGDGFTRRFLVRRGISSEFPASLKEYCIRPGDHLFVLGTLRENPVIASDAGRWTAGIGPQGPGFLSAAAADLQRQAVIEPMLSPASIVPIPPKSRPAQGEVFDLHPAAVLMAGRSSEPFFISWRSQRDIVAELALRSALYIWGGPVLAVAGLWLLVDHLLAN